MTAFRLISMSAHAALELVIGLALMAAPFALGVGTGGAVVAVLAGTVIVGLALATASAEGGSVSIAAHFAYDRGIALGLLVGALVLGLSAEPAAAAVLAAAAAGQLTLAFVTRYSPG